MIQIAGYLTIGLLGGISSGLLGIGGATIMIPALIFIFGFEQKIAQGTTLLLMVPPIGILAATEYYRKGYADVYAAVFIAIAFFVGGYFGSKIATELNPNTLRKIFSIFLMTISLKMFFS
jgi:uncharacterized protein